MRRFLVIALFPCACLDSSSSSTIPATDAGSSPDAATQPSNDAGANLPILEPCPAPSGSAGTEHKNDITQDETWTLAQSPHKIVFNTRILATVRIEPCATVSIGEGYSFTIGNTPNTAGTLIAKGERGVDTTGQPVVRGVTFAAADPAKPWGSIWVNGTGRLDLENVTLRDGASQASDQNGGGVVITYGNTVQVGPVAKIVRAVDVTVERSRGYGFNFQSFSGFTDDSARIVVRDSGRDSAAFPIRMLPGALATLPSVTLTGNKANEVQIIADNTAMTSDVIHARGVPYRVSGRFRVAPPEDGATVTLTIEAGVTMRFETWADSGLQIGTSDTRQGILVAEGTANAPIRFTSGKDVPAPADWKNIYFSYSPATGNRIRYAVVEYAGGASGAQGYGCGPGENDASVLLLATRPSDAFITDTTFQYGGGDTGLLLGWSSDLDGPNFLPTNSFTSMPSCKVSRWRNATGNACPGSVGGSPVCLL